MAQLPFQLQDALTGNPNAALSVGILLTVASAVERDEVAAGQWFLLAARDGHRDAYIQLGHRCLRGIGFPADEQAAVYWFHMGASSGDTAAMIALGSLHAAGRGVEQNCGRAQARTRELHRLASLRAAAAAALMSADEVNDAEQFVAALIKTGTSPMNR